MKKFIGKILVTCIFAVSGLSASADIFQFGPVVGLNIYSFTTNAKDLFSANNQAGFSGGLMAKVTAPVIGIGLDVAVMYERRNSEIEIVQQPAQQVKADYITVPLHLRYDLSLPTIGKIFKPGVFTGPNFAIKCNNEIINNIKSNQFNIGWDFGVALTFFDCFQLAGTYTTGLNDAINLVPALNIPNADVKGRTSGWLISAAYLF